MRKIKLFLFIWISLTIMIQAQTVRITGIVTDSKNEPVELANVRLFDTDSVFIGGTSSDRNGRIKLETNSKGSYKLFISAIGYLPVTISLKETPLKISLGNIVLQESSIDLDEVTVTANNIIRHIDRQVVFPTEFQQKSANSALDLLDNMSLPRLIVDTQNKKISLLGSDKIFIRINGVNATENDVSAIPAKDIVRVEYYDNPSVRFEGRILVDFIVKRKDNGGSVYLDLANSPHVRYGNDLVSIKLNHKNSEWNASYFMIYRNFKKSETKETTIFNFPDKSLTQYSDGTTPYNHRTHDLNLSYNYTLPEKRVFNFSLTNSIRDFNNHYDNTNTYLEIPDRAYQALTNTKNKNMNPILDLYYKENLSSRQSLTANLVGGYIHTDYSRIYKEENQSENQITELSNQVNGKKLSLIGEIVHQIEWDRLSLYSGINYKIGYSENNYTGSISEKTSLKNQDLYFYSQIQGKIKKINYGLGIGASYNYFNDSYNGFHFWTFRPYVSLAYSPVKNLNLQYTFRINSNVPSLNQLSDVEQQLDSYQLYKGNPHLTPYRIYMNKLNINQQIKTFQYTIEVSHQYMNKPIMPTTYFDLNNSLFIHTSLNQKYFQNTTIGAGAVWRLFNNSLLLNVSGQINWMDSKGYDYQHKYTSYYGMAALIFLYKNLSTQIRVNSRANDLWGETINYNQWWSSLNIGYKFKNLYVGLSIYHFLTGSESLGYTDLSKTLSQTSWSYTYDSAPTFCLKLSWNFKWGKQSQAEKKTLQNKDTDSGILKVE